VKRTGGYFEQVDTYSLTIKRRCELLGIGRWIAYQKPNKQDPAKLEIEELLMRRIDHWHTLMPYVGTRKLKKLLREKDGLKAGRKLIKRLMDKMGIYAIYPKPNLSKPGKEHKRFPYLLKNKNITFPNQVWAVDLSYIPMKRGHMYLTAIIDWHSRFIVGWELSDTLDATPVVEALCRAMDRHGIPGTVNSDQGPQFTSDSYISLLKDRGVRQSMDGKARWVDNVIVERWFRSLKTEYVYINDYTSPRELRLGIGEYVEVYNTLRPHESYDYDTPAAVYYESFSATKDEMIEAGKTVMKEAS
jgi:putative transposase